MRRTAAARLAAGWVLELRRRPPDTLVLRSEGEPGGEVMFRGPAREVGPDLGDQFERAVGGEAIDLREVDAGQMMERRADVDVGFVAVSAFHAWAWQRRSRRRDAGGQRLERGVDGLVARGELRLTHIEELEILLEDKEVFGPVVAGQGRGDLVGRGLAVRVAVLGEDVRVVLAGHEVTENLESGEADDVADDERQLEIHLDQALLHPPDVVPGGVHEDVAVAHEGAEGEDRRGGPEAAAQQADTVQLAQPLTVFDVAHVFDVAGVDEGRISATVSRQPPHSARPGSSGSARRSHSRSRSSFLRREASARHRSEQCR